MCHKWIWASHVSLRKVEVGFRAKTLYYSRVPKSNARWMVLPIHLSPNRCTLAFGRNDETAAGCPRLDVTWREDDGISCLPAVKDRITELEYQLTGTAVIRNVRAWIKARRPCRTRSFVCCCRGKLLVSSSRSVYDENGEHCFFRNRYERFAVRLLKLWILEQLVTDEDDAMPTHTEHTCNSQVSFVEP